MAWIYLAESVGLATLSENGSGQSPIVNLTGMLRASYCQECDQVTLVKLQYGTMCELSKDQCSQRSISFMAGSHAPISALQEMVQAWKESKADYFSRSCAWPKKSSPRSYSLKTCPQSERADLTALGNNWPSSGMICDGELFPLTMWERRTKEIGGFCLPTVSASSYGSNKGGAAGRVGKERPSLETMARKNLWPTPMATDYKNRGERKAHQQIQLQTLVGGQLNPTWVELLMGYPEGWAELNLINMKLKKQKQEPEKYCLTCSNPMSRHRYGKRLEDLTVFRRRKFCSLSCANTRQEVGYHGNSWRARQHLKDCCERCKSIENLHAHHSDENRQNNSSENIQTLCGSCHSWWHHEVKRLGIPISGKCPSQE
jgi:hypothetical protein